MPLSPIANGPSSPATSNLQAALADPRVVSALRLALRDGAIRERFETLRGAGLSVDEAIAHLLGPYADDDGRPYYLSEERVRTVVYRE